MIDDVELVHAAQAGNVAALGMLLESHRARLYATALAIVRDRAQAQDAVQEAFLVALRRIQDLREPAAAGAWLQTIVRNASPRSWASSTFRRSRATGAERLVLKKLNITPLS